MSSCSRAQSTSFYDRKLKQKEATDESNAFKRQEKHLREMSECSFRPNSNSRSAQKASKSKSMSLAAGERSFDELHASIVTRHVESREAGL